MKIGVRPFIVLLVTSILMVSSCQFRRYEKSDDWRVKYEAALQYYENEDYYRASVLFEQISPIVRGLPEGEQVQFYLAYCNYYQKMYLLASHHFKAFYESYGRSTLVEESRYMYAYSLYASAPDAGLDQTNSIEAITAMQNFVNRYPTSEFYQEANDIIFELQKRQEEKGYKNAYHYYKLRMYTAAIKALDNFRLEFPGSELVEDSEFYKLMSQYKYAQNSVQERQAFRYSKVKQLYLDFIDAFPESEYIKEAEQAYIDSTEKLNKFASNK